MAVEAPLGFCDLIGTRSPRGPAFNFDLTEEKVPTKDKMVITINFLPTIHFPVMVFNFLLGDLDLAAKSGPAIHFVPEVHFGPAIMVSPMDDFDPVVTFLVDNLGLIVVVCPFGQFYSWD